MTKKKTEQTFEQSMQRLNEIVNILESQQLDLEQSINLFEEGLLLAKQSQSTLEVYQNRLDSLIKQGAE